MPLMPALYRSPFNLPARFISLLFLIGASILPLPANSSSAPQATIAATPDRAKADLRKLELEIQKIKRDLADARPEAELRRLRLEIQKTELELADRERWTLTSFSTVSTVAGGFVLVVGFFVSVFQWFVQRRQERFTSLVQNLGGAHPSQRATAAAGLRLFLSPRFTKKVDRKLRKRALETLVLALGLEADTLVQRAIGKYLLDAKGEAEQPLLELMNDIRRIVNPKWNLIGEYFKPQPGTDQTREIRAEIKAQQHAFLVAALTIANIRESRPNLERAPFRELLLIEEQKALKGANFTQASLLGADFFNTNLEGANFTKADLAGAMFPDADLKDVVFDEAILLRTNFRCAKNLNLQAVLRAETLEGAEFDEDIREAITNLRKEGGVQDTTPGGTYVATKQSSPYSS